MPVSVLPPSSLSDPLPLAQALIRCASVTPQNDGAIETLEQALSALGFLCHRLVFGKGKDAIVNLYARLGTKGPHLCFAGHTDVVPAGSDWTHSPFAAEVAEDVLYGRGASDMKAAIAAFIAATAQKLEKEPLAGSLSLLITGDEEGVALNGTRKVLEWLKDRGETIDACLVGEPTNPQTLGEMIKIGRRGSLNGKLTVFGTQGHVAYPARADNPLPRLVKMLSALDALELDHGTPHFDPSHLALTSIDVGNPATNVIPAQATAAFNIRFNDLHTGASLSERLQETLIAANGSRGTDGFTLEISISGEAFLTPPGNFSDLLCRSIQEVTGKTPELSTSGGTSDARFIKDICAVAEFGLVGASMHKADENCRIEDLVALTAIYRRLLDGFFSPSQAENRPC